MSKTTNTALALALVFSTTGAAFAEAGHHDGGKAGAGKANPPSSGAMADSSGPMGMMGQGGMMDGDHRQMMQGMMKMMMQMHGGMMGGGMGNMGAGMGNMGGGMGNMGAARSQGMMGQDMMSLMRGSMMDRFDVDGDGIVSGDEALDQLQSMHADADTNGDGALSLEEFEVLHGEITRSMMVDRFQYLDSDGDGMVTPSEMTTPAKRMNMRPSSEGMMGDDTGTEKSEDTGTENSTENN